MIAAVPTMKAAATASVFAPRRSERSPIGTPIRTVASVAAERSDPVSTSESPNSCANRGKSGTRAA